MTDHDTEGLLKEIDDGPFIALGLLADKARDRGEDALAAALDWLVAWRRYPDRLPVRGCWRWVALQDFCFPGVNAKNITTLPKTTVRRLVRAVKPTGWLWDRSPNYLLLSEAYMAAAKALAATMPTEFLNQRPKARKGKK